MKHRIIPSTINLLHGRVNFEHGLVLIHCAHNSGGCWHSNKGVAGICGLSLERL